MAGPGFARVVFLVLTVPGLLAFAAVAAAAIVATMGIGYLLWERRR